MCVCDDAQANVEELAFVANEETVMIIVDLLEVYSADVNVAMTSLQQAGGVSDLVAAITSLQTLLNNNLVGFDTKMVNLLLDAANNTDDFAAAILDFASYVSGYGNHAMPWGCGHPPPPRLTHVAVIALSDAESCYRSQSVRRRFCLRCGG